MLLRESPEEWTVLSLPAIAEEAAEIQIGQDKVHFRQIGDVLHPEREPLSILESYRAQMGSDVFAAQYMQCPVPRDGVMIKRSWPRRYDQLPKVNASRRILQSWDTATKDGEHASYSVCTTWRFQDGRYYLLDVFRERVDYPQLKAQAFSLALQIFQRIVLEDIMSLQKIIDLVARLESE